MMSLTGFESIWRFSLKLYLILGELKAYILKEWRSPIVRPKARIA
jgi:hypothetical protein